MLLFWILSMFFYYETRGLLLLELPLNQHGDITDIPVCAVQFYYPEHKYLIICKESKRKRPRNFLNFYRMPDKIKKLVKIDKAYEKLKNGSEDENDKELKAIRLYLRRIKRSQNKIFAEQSLKRQLRVIQEVQRMKRQETRCLGNELLEVIQ